MTETSAVNMTVRSVTVDEISFFFEHGWVKLPGLVNTEGAVGLLAGAKRLLGERGDAPLANAEGRKEKDFTWFRTYVDAGRDDEFFAALANSRELGHNAARLFGRDSSIRRMQDSLMVKLPASQGRNSAPTLFHQDTRDQQFFEANSLNVWLALDEVTPDMGALQFYSGSHKLGNLGSFADREVRQGWGDRLAQSCSLTEPIHLLPGDATVHTHYTIHGTGENSTDRPRWAWGSMLLPGDALYTGARSSYTDGLGLEPWKPFDVPNFPVIYDPDQIPSL
jgi:hypothetical protein